MALRIKIALLSIVDNPIIIKLLITIVTFFAPIKEAMIAVGILIVIDTIMGVVGAKRIGEDVSSKKFGRVLTKSLSYQLLIISAHLAEVYLVTSIPFLKISLTFLAITEILSIGENFYKCTGKNFIKYFKEFLDSKLRHINTTKKNG